MSKQTVHLAIFRPNSRQRGHFGIYIHRSSSPGHHHLNPDHGTLINVVGAPMIGFRLQFKRNFAPSEEATGTLTIVPIGSVDQENAVSDDAANDDKSEDDSPRSKPEIIACQLSPPRISENFMAPVNDTTNRRCQEWTMDYVRRLVDLKLIEEAAIDVVQSKRDPPGFGIGLQPIGAWTR